ncbi:hypothetical protein Leryth_025457 [Lithospermum erythrorhizon]|nr:hypothetical protein Leryth_025457 [Lithospermum erythrorhizon]
MGETSRYRKPRIQNQNQNNPNSIPDPNTPQIPCVIQSKPSKTTISSILLSTFSPTNTPSIDDQNNNTIGTTVYCMPKKKNFGSSKFRGMGCTATSQVSVPAVIRTSANWEAKIVKKKKLKSKKNKVVFSQFADNNNNNSYLGVSSSCVGVPDVWCGPEAASVDCVVSRRAVSDRGKVDGERNTYRERPSCLARRIVSPEDIHFVLPDSALGVSRSRLDISGSRHRHGRHGHPEGLAEIVMLQSSLMMGGRPNRLDPYRGWRLDVDNMSYEELLELGDRIGYVSTGLRDDEISGCLRKTKISGDNAALHIPTEMEKKCSICQEEYEAEDEMGKLKCGHFYHIDCIKQWLVQKNCCPVCKTSAASHG